MKASSLGEPHRNMGSRVRNARKHGSILVRDRNTPVAVLVPVSAEPAVNRFAGWRPMKTFAAALDRVVVGRPVEELIGEDRRR